MEIKNNVMRVNRAELNQLIETATLELMKEGKFGDIAKKVGKGIGKAALATGLAGAALYAADRGAEKNYQYGKDVNKQAAEMSKDPQAEYLKKHGIDPKTATPEDWKNAKINITNESIRKRITPKMLESVIRKSLKKVLG